ncbi:hypothetical protein M8J76_016066 [Diaphorina citri]|nr:hypothetical protein M8J76_016066 [Diaphorina citri]
MSLAFGSFLSCDLGKVSFLSCDLDKVSSQSYDLDEGSFQSYVELPRGGEVLSSQVHTALENSSPFSGLLSIVTETPSDLS